MKPQRSLTRDVLLGVATTLATTWWVGEAANALADVAAPLALGVFLEAVLRMVEAT